MLALTRPLHISDLLKNQRVAWLVLFVSLMVTGVAWFITDRYIENSVRQRFDFRVNEIGQSISKRLKESQTVLRATAAFIHYSDEVTTDEWRGFVDVLNIPETFPGMQGFAYLPLIARDQLKDHILELGLRGATDYKVWPEGDRELYAPIAYIGPETESNKAGLGFDAYSDPVRRAVMEHARDIAEPAISPRVQLVLDKGEDRAGFVFYMPIYVSGLPTQSMAERRLAIRGYTLNAFRADVFFKGIGLGDHENIDLEVYDAPAPRAGGLLFQNSSDDGVKALAPARRGALSAMFEIPNRPRSWGVFIQARPEFWTSSERFLPLMVAIGGLVIDFLLFLTVWALGRNRQHLEQLSENLKEQLTSSEQVLGSAVEAMGEAFVIYDADDRLIYCNELYREIYEVSAPVIEVGRTFEEIIRYGAERGQYVAAVGRVDEWVAERMERHRAANSELVQQLDDGRWIRIRERRTTNGHIIGIRMDLTEVYRAKEAAEAASRAKSRFLATVSHEIRTPMNGILGMAQILLDPEIPADKREEHVRTILRAGQALLSLLNDILDLSKVEAGRLELFPVSFSPVSLVEETIRLFAAAANNKGLLLNWRSSIPGKQRFQGDTDRLRQMLSNLIGNAIKFSVNGEILVVVDTHEESAQGVLLEFSIHDAGPGISVEEQLKLFEPFSQVDDSATRQHGGTGLGLSIVRQLARLMGGEAGVDSTPGSGSRFWFRVLVKPDTNAAIADAASEKHAYGQRDGEQVPHLVGHVLVAEDNATHRLVISSALARLGLLAIEVENGQQAVDAVTSGSRFDLILMDLLMPTMDGLTATVKIRDWCEGQQLAMPTVLAITAKAFDSDREQCLAAGMVGVITKPVDFNSFTRTLAEYLPEANTSSRCRMEHRVDRELVLDLIGQLMPLLSEHKFDAFACFSRLKSAVAGTALADEVEKAGALLNRMEFNQVIEAMNRLADGLGGAKDQ
ncbi:MAG: Response regulator receiver:ATP-binding region, ATPase-like:Histidine kinase N-terminal [Proteobacteria bacterium]|nr:Response regulator receiver:ATP-binding region, ATPase-like:Histidine kinase N-terminal [Pseudomonadota bacterium]